jgi:hypothetical protein
VKNKTDHSSPRDFTGERGELSVSSGDPRRPIRGIELASKKIGVIAEVEEGV